MYIEDLHCRVASEGNLCVLRRLSFQQASDVHSNGAVAGNLECSFFYVEFTEIDDVGTAGFQR